MANPATLLADQIEAWAVPRGQMPEQARAVDGQGFDSREFWERHERVVGYLAEIERALTAMEAGSVSVQHYRAELAAWYRAVFAQSVPWGQNAGQRRVLLEPASLNVLRALAQHIDETDYVPVVSDSDLDNIRRALDLAQTLISEADGLSRAVRRYLYGLVREALECADELDVFGSVALRSRIFELGGAMTNTAATTAIPDETEKKRWYGAAREIVTTLGVSVAANMISTGTMDALGTN